MLPSLWLEEHGFLRWYHCSQYPLLRLLRGHFACNLGRARFGLRYSEDVVMLCCILPGFLLFALVLVPIVTGWVSPSTSLCRLYHDRYHEVADLALDSRVCAWRLPSASSVKWHTLLEEDTVADLGVLPNLHEDSKIHGTSTLGSCPLDATPPGGGHGITSVALWKRRFFNKLVPISLGRPSQPGKDVRRSVPAFGRYTAALLYRLSSACRRRPSSSHGSWSSPLGASAAASGRSSRAILC